MTDWSGPLTGPHNLPEPRSVTMKEPVAIGAAIVAAVNAFVVLAVAFGVEITTDQAAAINGAMVAIVGAVAAVVRSKVTPVSVD